MRIYEEHAHRLDAVNCEPTRVMGHAVNVFSFLYATLVIAVDRELWGWGGNGSGQLGPRRG